MLIILLNLLLFFYSFIYKFVDLFNFLLFNYNKKIINTAFILFYYLYK